METYFPDLMNSPSFYSILEPPPQANEPEALSQNPECVCCSHACLTTLLTCQVWKFLLASHPGDHEVSSKTSHVPVEHMFPSSDFDEPPKSHGCSGAKYENPR
jgi:hypothetical protein